MPPALILKTLRTYRSISPKLTTLNLAQRLQPSLSSLLVVPTITLYKLIRLNATTSDVCRQLVMAQGLVAKKLLLATAQ